MMRATFPRCVCNCRKHLGILFLFIAVISYSQSSKSNTFIDSTSINTIENNFIVEKDNNISEKVKIYIIGNAQIYGIDKVNNYILYRKNNHSKIQNIQPKKLVKKRKETINIKNKLPDVIIKDLDRKNTFAMESNHYESATINNQVISKYYITSIYPYQLILCIYTINIFFPYCTFSRNRRISFPYSRPPPMLRL